jgi:YggT family protein
LLAQYVLYRTVAILLQVLNVLLFAYVIMSWVRPRYYTRSNRWFFVIDDFVHRLLDPLLNPIRSLLPTSGIGLDFSVIIFWVLLDIVGTILLRALNPF